MATSTVNGASAIEGNGSISKISNSIQPPSKASLGGKMADGPKKGNDDGSQRRAPEPRAWTSGMNPITQRANTPLQSNGTALPSKASQKTSNPQDSYGTFLQMMSERSEYVLGVIYGHKVTILTTQGEKYRGVFAGLSGEGNDIAFLFKMVRALRPGANGIPELAEEYSGTGIDYSMVFNGGDVLSIVVDKVSSNASITQNGNSQGFRTDADISGNLALRERNLQRWEAPTQGAEVDMSIESGGGWDQFKANEERFGLKSDYNENIYTTEIDKSNPLYALREREAARLAREIESNPTTNAHMREERGLQQKEDGLDEEAKYSGVQRNGQEYPPLKSNQPNKYTPPARRPPVVAPASGGSVDPAIISSQIARPTSKTREPEAAKGTQATPARANVTATENVESELLDSFRQFANTEKMKVQDSRRSRASADKAVKINDLMKFAKNFKLLTPVPKDLVPILAKSESKQKEIVEKAQRIVEATNANRSAAAESKALVAAQWEGEPATASTDAANRSRRQDPVQVPQAPKDRQHPARDPSHPARPTQNGLSQRLADSHRLHKANAPASIPTQDGRVPPIRPVPYVSGNSSPQKSAGIAAIRSPTNSTSAKLNVKAVEFKPNPSAVTFKPSAANTTVGSTPRSVTPAIPQSLFGDSTLKPIDTRATGLMVDPFEVLRAEAAVDPKAAKDRAENGEIRRAYSTIPTWRPAKNNQAEYTSYKDSPALLRRNKRTPQQSPPINPAAHQHQLPFHLQNGSHAIPQVHTPQTAHHVHTPHHYPQHHYDDHHMRPSASSSSVFPAPSPRMQNTNMAYHSPMGHHAQLAYGQQPMPQYVMSPNGPQASPRHFSGPNMMGGQGGHLSAPMMVPQPSGGGYMMAQPIPMPFNPMYTGSSPQQYGMPSQPPSGYPSPGRGAPMMMHQGSHQGQHQPMYMPGQFGGQPVYAQHPPAHMSPMRGNYGSPQPHFAQTPYQQHQYPHQAHRTPSAGYAQLSQGHHQHMNSQAPLPAPPNDMGDESK